MQSNYIIILLLFLALLHQLEVKFKFFIIKKIIKKYNNFINDKNNVINIVLKLNLNYKNNVLNDKYIIFLIF